jgi:ribonuclease Z
VGWGHSSIEQALEFAALARVGTLVAFHHDPAHADDELDRLYRDAARNRPFELVPAREGDTLDVARSACLSA